MSNTLPTITVIGAGYVGMSLAALFSKHANVKVWEGMLNGAQTSAIDASGAAAFGSITFGSVPGSTTDAHTLDDYEEGTFTPAFSGPSVTWSYTTQVGRYTKVGEMVHIFWQIEAELVDITGGNNAQYRVAYPFRFAAEDRGVTPLDWTNAGGTPPAFAVKTGASNGLSDNLLIGYLNTTTWPPGVTVSLTVSQTYTTR